MMTNNNNVVLGFTPSPMHNDLKKQDFSIDENDIPQLSINKYPLFISEEAIPIWKRVIHENRPALRKFDKKRDKWVAAIILFRDACALAKIPPFTSDVLPPSANEALVYMEGKAVTSAQMFNEFAQRVFPSLDSRGASLIRVNKPTLTGPDGCPFYAAMDCYKFSVISRFRGVDSQTVANTVKSQGSFTLYNAERAMYQGPTKNGVRSLCYVTAPTRNAVVLTWVGSVFAQSYTSLRGIKKRIIDKFASHVRWK